MTLQLDTDRPAPATAIFGALEAEGLCYAVWKDAGDVLRFAEGDGELDLLVDPCDRARLRALALAHGYAEFRNRYDPWDGRITHFLRFTDGRFHHLHVFFAMLCGDHGAKEYRLDPLFPEALARAERCHGVRVLDERSALAIEVLRGVLRPPGRAAQAQLDALRRGYEARRLARGIRALRRAARLPPPAVEGLRRALLAGAPASALAGVRGHFDGLRRCGRLRARWLAGCVRARAAWDRRRGLQNKVLPGPAPSIAIVGVDGSGKSSLVRALCELLGRKVSCRRIYLGGNASTYGVLSWVAYAAWAVAERVARRAPGSATGATAVLVARTVLESAKCRDRLRRIRKGQRLARRGVIVLYERFPIVGLFDAPRLLRDLEAEGSAGGPRTIRLVRAAARRIDATIARTGRPDLTLLVRTPPERILERRGAGPAEREDIRAKLALLRDFSPAPAASHFVEIDNAGSFATTLSAALERVNEVLCSRSS